MGISTPWLIQLLSVASPALSIIRNAGGILSVPSPASCYQDSAGTTPCAVDDPIGYLRDLVGTNHATQVTAGFKPILRGKEKNWLKYSDQLNGAGWGSNNILAFGAGSTANAINSANGELIADFICPNTTSSTHYMVPSIDSIAGTYTCRFYAKAGGYSRIGVRQQTSGSFEATFILSGAGSIIANNGADNASITLISDGWYEIIITDTVASSISILRFYVLPDAFVSTAPNALNFYSWAGDGVSGVYFSEFMLTNGDQSYPYISTGATTKSSSYGPYWMDFDGTDDRLNMTTVPIPAATPFCIVASANPMANSGNIFSESDTVSTDALINLGTDTANLSANARRDNAASFSQATIASTLGQQKIFTGYYDETKNNIRINSSEGTSANVAQGATTLTTAVIGARNNGSYNSFFKGPLYAIAIVPNMLSVQNLLTVERYLAGVSGVAL